MIQVETGTMIVSGRSDWPNRGEERLTKQRGRKKEDRN